jgi:tetratricopeptide (TPR) repeat protein
MFLQQRGRSAEAIVQFQRALDIDPRTPGNGENLALALLHAGRAADALAVLDKHPFSTGDHLALRGSVLLVLGRFPEAIQALRRAVALDGTNPDSLYDLAITLLKTDNTAEAIILLDRGRRRFPRVAKIHAASGMVAYLNGRNAEAVRAYRTAAKLEPDAADLHASLGDVYGATGDFDRAQSAYARSVKLDPSVAEVHVKAGRNFLKLERPGDAEAAFARALDLNPSHAEANFQLGKLAAARGNHAEAVARFEKSAGAPSPLKEAWYQLSLSYRRLGREQEAAAAMERFRKQP